MKRFYPEISEELEEDVCSVSAGACPAVWAMTCYDKKHYRVTSAVQNPSHPAVCKEKRAMIAICCSWVGGGNWSRLDYRQFKRLKGGKIFKIAHTHTHVRAHTHTRTYTHACTNTHTQAHTYTHAQTHTHSSTYSKCTPWCFYHWEDFHRFTKPL